MSERLSETNDQPESGADSKKDTEAGVESVRELIASTPEEAPEESDQDPRNRLSYIEAFLMTDSAPWYGYDDSEDES